MNKVRLFSIFLVITGVLLLIYTENELLDFLGGASLGCGSMVVFSGRRTFKRSA